VAVADVVMETDWAEHWRGLVRARLPQQRGSWNREFWDGRARGYAFSMRGQSDWFGSFLEPWLQPSRTLIDVGAGTGRLVAPVTGRLDWVTAVEPSEGMRAHIPPADNLTVIGSTWQDAEPAPADLVTCVHVLYGVEDVVPFVEKLERAATERVFIVLRDSPPRSHPVELLRGPDHPREPRLRDLFLLLGQMGVTPDVAVQTYAVFGRFESLDSLVAECRQFVGDTVDEAQIRALLEPRLRRDEDGSLVYEGGDVTSGVVHWRPRG
jgi:hypothetical protein